MANNTMDAIKKKMQAMKSEKDQALDKADQLEQKVAEQKAINEKVPSPVQPSLPAFPWALYETQTQGCSRALTERPLTSLYEMIRYVGYVLCAFLTLQMPGVHPFLF